MHRNFGQIFTILLLLVITTGLPVFAGGSGEERSSEVGSSEAGSGETNTGEARSGEAGSRKAGSNNTASNQRALRVVATTNIIGDVVSNIAGKTIELSTLVAAGQNPHSYEATPRAIVTVEQADIVFVNGFELEEGLLDIVKQTATGQVISLSRGIDGMAGDDHKDEEGDDAEDDHDEAYRADEDDAHGAVDPHTWFSPQNVLIWIDTIEAELIEADPEHASQYRHNATAYRARVQDLHVEILRNVERIPRERRKLVVDHISLGYFARDYGFDVIGTAIPAASDQVEPSARAIADLVEVIREQDVPVVFVGETASSALHNLMQAIADEVGRNIRVMSLLTGSLASPGESGDTYLSYMSYNIAQIMEGLGY